MKCTACQIARLQYVHSPAYFRFCQQFRMRSARSSTTFINVNLHYAGLYLKGTSSCWAFGPAFSTKVTDYFSRYVQRNWSFHPTHRSRGAHKAQAVGWKRSNRRGVAGFIRPSVDTAHASNLTRRFSRIAFQWSREPILLSAPRPRAHLRCLLLLRSSTPSHARVLDLGKPGSLPRSPGAGRAGLLRRLDPADAPTLQWQDAA
jgi:hypothetical protein